MIKRSESLLASDCLLSLVNLLLQPDEELTSGLFVETYTNGQEIGYAIRGSLTHFGGYVWVIAQYRNSDELVIYEGDYCTDFNCTGNTPGEKAYRQRKSFPLKKIYEAATYIAESVENRRKPTAPERTPINLIVTNVGVVTQTKRLAKAAEVTP